MNRLILCMLIGTLSAACLAALHFLYRQTLYQLSELLYKKHDPDAFLAKLESYPALLLINKKKRKILSIDALMLKNNRKKAEMIMKELEQEALSFSQRILLFQKQIAFYLESYEGTKAIEAYLKLKEETEEFADDSILQIVEECDILIHVYARKDGLYAEKLVQKAERLQESIPKGICYYRAGVSYYHLQDENHCRMLLERAQQFLKNTIFEKNIDQILNQDLQLIEKRIM